MLIIYPKNYANNHFSGELINVNHLKNSFYVFSYENVSKYLKFLWRTYILIVLVYFFLVVIDEYSVCYLGIGQQTQ